MEAEKILQARYLDIVFENRNKSYGAYQLRTDYENKVMKALLLMLMTIPLVYLLAKDATGEKINPAKNLIETTLYKMASPATPKPPTPASKPAGQTPKNNPSTGSLIQITDSNQVTRPIPDSGDIHTHTTGNPAGPGTTGGNCPTCKPDSITTKPTVTSIVDPGIPLPTAEIMPSFPGGMTALRQFLETHLNTPSELNEGEKVSVKIKFVVGYDGVLKGFEIIEDGGEPFNKEVVRVLQKMPRWIPGQSKGRNVSVYYVIPVTFMASEQ